jgi:hypothetical protein
MLARNQTINIAVIGFKLFSDLRDSQSFTQFFHLFCFANGPFLVFLCHKFTLWRLF